MDYLLHKAFSDNIKHHPEKTAVLDEGGRRVSYQELERLSCCFAHSLLEHRKPAKNKNYIGVLADVSSRGIAAILGILKIGCAYVPLDKQSPPERLKLIIQRAKLDILIVQKEILEAHPFLAEIIGEKIVIWFDHNYDSPVNSVLNFYPPRILSDDLAYILHSSGSTGEPKGIMLTHRNARTFVDWMQKEFKLCPDDVVMSRSPFNFDLSVFDIFNTFLVGATLVCFDWRKHRSEGKHRAYVHLLESECATFLYTTPSTLVTLMHKGGLGQNTNSLRTVMYAGEPFPIQQLKSLCSRHPHARVANIYGPTETNIITYFWVDRIDDNWKAVPLGKVVDDTEIIVVNDHGNRICDVNEVGELWCRGGTVTLGYLGLDSLTKKCLVQSPFHNHPVRYWRTGDYGFLDSEGNLHYQGRKDHLVKYKGYRIELGEIEAAFASIQDISLSCVVYSATSEKQLACFYSTKHGKPLPKEKIDNHLAQRLPGFMLPSKYLHYDELPKTSSGKVDRISLKHLLENLLKNDQIAPTQNS